MIVVKNLKLEKKEEIWIEENKLKENNKKTKRELLSSSIIKKIPNWKNLFFVVNDFEETYFQQNHELFIFNNKNTNFILLKYKINNNYNSFFFNEELNTIQEIGNFIFSFQSILDKIILLKKNNIHFIGFNYNNIKINKNNDCFLCNLENSIYGDLFENYDFNEFSEKYYIFYPLEYHFIRYLILNKINSPTIETIEKIVGEWETKMNEYFDENNFSILKNIFINNFYSFINQKVEKIYNYINKNINSWSLYGFNILFLYFLYNLNSKNEIIEKIHNFILFHINKKTEIDEYKLLFEEMIYSFREEEWKYNFSNNLLLKNHKFLFIS